MDVDEANKWEVKLTSISNKDINERECFQVLEQFSISQISSLNKAWIQKITSQLNKYKNYKITQEDQIKILNKRISQTNDDILQDNLTKIDLIMQKK